MRAKKQRPHHTPTPPPAPRGGGGGGGGPTAPTERANVMARPTGGGMMGAAAGKGGPKLAAHPKEKLAEERMGTDSMAREREPACPWEHRRKTQGLTEPSSATEAGEEGRGLQDKADRQPLFAGARCWASGVGGVLVLNRGKQIL